LLVPSGKEAIVFDPSSESIQDHILRVPRLYIGHDFDTDGLHFLIRHIVRSAVQEDRLNEPSRVFVIVNSDTEIEVTDNGRGLPITKIPIGNIEISPIEHILRGYMRTSPDTSYYQTFGFLDHAATVLAAVAYKFTIRTNWNNELYELEVSRRKITTPLYKISNSSESGTKIVFSPSPEVFSDNSFKIDLLKSDLTEIAKEFPHILFKLLDKRSGEEIVYNMTQ